MTEALEQVPDAELIAAVRQGDVAAFGVLYERHLVPAKRAAACLAKTPAEREDLVAEAFTRVLRMLREGRGPDEEFRPYLLVTLRNTAINGTTRGAPVSLYADVPEVCPAGAADEPVIDRWHATVAADAFASLPERWRMVLWHTEVEDESPATVAPLLGMRPNSVAALAYRAREGLRQAYLRMHVPEPPRRECRATVDKLAGYVRRSIPPPLSRKINRHLHTCSDCRARADALTKLNAELRGWLGPVVLGAPLAAAYLPAPVGVTAVSGAFSGAVTGVVSGAASGTTSAAVSTTVAGSVASGVVAVTAEATAASVSGVFAVKAVVVQVAAAVTVAATAVTATSSAAAPDPAGSPVASSARLPSAVHSTASHAASPGAPADRAPAAPRTPPGSSVRATPATGTGTPATPATPAADADADAEHERKGNKGDTTAAETGAAAGDTTAAETGAAAGHTTEPADATMAPPNERKAKKGKKK